eukprot:c12865_g1_i3 orf=213-2087(+)
MRLPVMDDLEVIDEINSEAQVYMACILQGHKLGVAYYDANSRELFVLDSWEDGYGEFSFVQLLKHQVQPLVIYTSTKMDESFLAALGRKEVSEAPEVKLVKSSIFSYEHAWHRLSFLHVHGMPEDLSHKERTYLLNSMMNLDSEMQVRAAGGLLTMLQEELLVDTIDMKKYETCTIQIQTISEISLDRFLMIDAATHYALQIFQVDKHPSYMGIGKSKEGFSLFGMFVDKCVTSMGRCLLRRWFLRPIIDLDVLNDRLEFISIFWHCDEMVAALYDTLKHVKDIPHLLKKFCSPSSMSTSVDWQQLSKSICSILHIQGIVEVGISQRQHDKDGMLKLATVKKILLLPSDEMLHINDLIYGAIDFDQTCGERSETMIAYGLCEEVATLEMNRIQKQHSTVYGGSIIYMPQVGYLMCFSGKKLDSDVLDVLPDIEFAFSGADKSEEEFFYRTSKTKELDSVLGDIYHKILDMERAILRDLELRVESVSLLLIEAASIAAELDCLLSLTSIAREYNYVRPTLTDGNVLHIKNGRLVLGHALPSFGLHCAELAGVAFEILNRASSTLGQIQNCQPIQRICSEKMALKDKHYRVLVENLLKFDCKHGNVKEFLAHIFSSDIDFAQESTS